MKKAEKPLLKVPSLLRNHREVPQLNANIVLHGFPGGIRHEPIDLPAQLAKRGFIVEGDTLRVEGEKYPYEGADFRDSFRLAVEENPGLKDLFELTSEDPKERVQSYIDSIGLDGNVDYYLFEEVDDDETEVQLDISRVYRREMGRPLDKLTKWSQGGKFGDGYVAWKFDVTTEEDVYHVGAGNWFGQTEYGIKTSGKVRAEDPQRDGKIIERDPPEMVCVSDCSYGDGVGMSNVDYFYKFYDHWRKVGKDVFFKGDLCKPPDFPCVILSQTRPHNREFIGRANLGITSHPDFVEARRVMSLANATRNKKTARGQVEWPLYDKERVEELLCSKNKKYNFRIPAVIDKSRKITDKARFPVTRAELRTRFANRAVSRAFRGISSSVIVYLFVAIKDKKPGMQTIDLLAYPYVENHQFVDEILWSMDHCLEVLGLAREKNVAFGMLTSQSKLNYMRFM